MYLSDYHTHCSLSFDSKTPVEDMVRAGIAQGLQEMCLTDHVDLFRPRETAHWEHDFSNREETFARADQAADGNIIVRRGIELGEAMRDFANKIWNASRYVLMNLTIDEPGLPALDQLEIEDKWVLSKLNTLIREVTENMDAYELGVASAKVYDFIWDTYCDWYIELTKTRLYSENEQSKLAAQRVLVYVLDQILRLLHPFMPFITEEIWQAIPHEGKFIMASDWPVWRDELAFPQDEESMELIKDAITAIRARRAEMNVPANKRVNMTISTQRQNVFTAGIPFFGRLAGAEGVTVSDTVDKGAMEREGMVEVVTHAARIFIPLAELVDFEKELARIAKEKENCLKQIAMFEGKLSNESFVSRAPEKVVNDQREKLAKAKALLEQLEESEKRLKK